MSDTLRQDQFLKQLTPDDIKRHFEDEAAQILAGMLVSVLPDDRALLLVRGFRAIHELLTRFALAEQDEKAFAAALEERRRLQEMDARASMEQEIENRGRRSSRPV